MPALTETLQPAGDARRPPAATPGAPGGPARTSSGRLTSRRLVGRSAELEALVGAIIRPPCLVRVEGGSGVGKTRLVQEALPGAALGGRPRLVGKCHQLREPFPLGPVMEALREAGRYIPSAPNPVMGALRPLLPELADRLPPPPDPLGDPRAERHRVFRAVAAVLDALGPCVLVLEDIHWADEGTIELLRFLLGLPIRGLSVVVTLRPEDLSRQVVGLSARNPVAEVRVGLEPLDADLVGELASEILEAGEISPEFAGYLHERTGGVPFAVEEVLRLMQERRDIVRRGGRWSRRTLEELEVPPAIRDWILERMARLAPGARTLLRAAAVLEAVPAVEVIARVAGLPEEDAPGGLAEASDAGLLHDVEPGRPGFRHSLARQAVYEDIPEPERRRLHLRAARALEARDPERSVARLAHHYRHAGRREWVGFAERAVDLAVSLGDDATASGFLREALAAPGLSRVVRARLALKLGRAALQGFAHVEAISVLRGILEHEDLPAGVRGELRYSLGQLIGQAGDSLEGQAEVKRALPELRRRPDKLARAMTSLAWIWVSEGTLAEHLRWLRRAVETVSRASDPDVRLAVLADRAAILTSIADPQAEEAVRALPVDITSVTGRRHLQRAWANLAQGALTIGHYGRARGFLERAVEMSEELTYMRDSGVLEATGVLLDFFTGAWEGLGARARRLSEATADVPHASVDAQLVAGLLDLARGDLDRAEATLSEAQTAARAAGSIQIVAAASAGLARLHLGAGDAGAAAAEASRGVELLRRKGVWVWGTDVVPAAVEALLSAGRRSDAEELTGLFERGVRRRDAPGSRGGLMLCRAALLEAAGDGRGAARWAARAARVWDPLPRPYDRARAVEVAGRNLLAAGVTRGGELLEEARERFDRLGAAWDGARVRQTLRSHGLVAPHRRGRRGYGDRLSPREEEVVRLVVEGRTYREIAAALFLSPRTVEHHVEKAVRKLGVASRGELYVPETPGASP